MKKEKTQTTQQVAYTGDIPNTPMRFLWYLVAPYKLHILGMFVVVTIGTAASSVSPFFFKQIIDGITLTTDFEQQRAAFVFWGTAYIFLLAAMWAAWRSSGFIGLRLATYAQMRGFDKLYEYVMQHDHSYFSNRFAGSVANKIAHASDGATDILEEIMWGYYERVLGLMLATGFMLYTDVTIGLIFAALVVVLVIMNIPLLKHRRPHVVALAEASSTMKGVGIDMLTNISAVRQYVKHDAEQKRFRTYLEDMRLKDIRQWQLAEWSFILNNALIVCFLAAIIYVLLSLFDQGQVTAGDIVLVLSLLFSTSGTLTFISNSMARFIRRYGDVQEGLSDTLLLHGITDKPDAKNLKTTNGQIDWKQVNFEFGETTVFKDFNLTIKPGQRVGLVGHSGAGKTTFVSLLLRQHDLTGGAIEIDDQNIAHVKQDSLREKIAVVPQEPMLFHRSIKDNIAYSRPTATLKEVEAVAKKAHAHDFVSELEEGYNTLVGERGVKLSGGQKQRIAIARAMLKDAPILILDEATSALDSESEVEIQKALHKLMQGKTVIAVAHRLSTLREMDRIIVLEDGKVIEDGSHDALVSYGGVYAKLWEHQAGGFLQD